MVITKIWVPFAGSSGVISLGCLIEGADNSSMKTPGGTSALSDPSLARTSAAMLDRAGHVEFPILDNVFRVFIF